jgi:transposase
MEGEKDTKKQLVERGSNLNLRQQRRDERHERYAEIFRLRQAGQSPRQIAPKTGMSVRTIERWLAAGGEPEHRRPPAERTCIEPFRDHLERRWQEGQHEGVVLLAEIQKRGFTGGKATFYRWLASYQDRPQRTPRAIVSKSDHRVPSRRTCAWLLGQAPDKLDEASQRFLRHLYECSPPVRVASKLARRLAVILRGDDEAALDQWAADAVGSELDSLAKGIRRDIAAVKAAVRLPWSTSPVESRINRLKTLKRQMYGRAGCELLRSRLMAPA